MRWRTAGLCALSLAVMTGCPEEFGKEGRINRAVHKDTMELLQKSCSEEDAQQYCANGQEQSEECLKRCGS